MHFQIDGLAGPHFREENVWVDGADDTVWGGEFIDLPACGDEFDVFCVDVAVYI